MYGVDDELIGPIFVGECTRGDSCRYSHNLEGGAATSFGGPRRSNICFAFQKGMCQLDYVLAFFLIWLGSLGECERGESCRFVHEADNSWGGGNSSYNNNRGPRNNGVCYAFQKGECERGASCRYSHEAGGK